MKSFWSLHEVKYWGRLILSLTVYSAARSKSRNPVQLLDKETESRYEALERQMEEIQPENNNEDDTFCMPRNLW